MANKTFFNLPEERQREIFNISIEEFSRNGYKAASLSRIVKELGIARGSFYRYFENKKDLYDYLLGVAAKINSDLKKEYLENPERDFFDAWLDFGIVLLKKEVEYPHLVEFLSRVSREMNNQSKEKLRIELFSKMLELHRSTGQIRTDISVEVQAYYLMSTREGIRGYLLYNYGLDINSEDFGENRFFQMCNDEIHKDLEGFITLLRDALEDKSWKKRS